MPLIYTIGKIREATTLSPETTGFRRLKVVPYWIGQPGQPLEKQHGPFQIEIEADEFSPERVKLRLDQELAHFVALFPEG